MIITLCFDKDNFIYTNRGNSRYLKMICVHYVDNDTRTDVFINQIYPVERPKKTILSFLIRDLPHYIIQGKQGSSFYEEK